MRRLLFTGVIVVVMSGVLLATGSVAEAASEVTIVGTVVLDDGFGTAGRPCTGTGRFADLIPGAKIEIRNDHKKLLKTATLGSGAWTPAFVGSSFVSCEFGFSAVVPDAKSYVLKVGKQPGRKVTRKALAASGGRLELRIG